MLENLFSSKVLFTILAVLFQKPDKILATSEIIKLADKKQTNVLRELDKLTQWEIVIKTQRGNQNFYQLNKNHFYYNQLQDLLKKYNKQNKKYILFTEEGNPSLLALNYFSKGYANDLAVRLGILNQLPNLVTQFKNNYVWFYLTKETWFKTAKESLKKILADSLFVKEIIYSRSVAKGEEALKIFKQLQAKNFKVDKKQALDLLDKFTEITSEQISCNFIAIFDLIDLPYSNYLRKYLESKIKNTDLRLNYVLEKLLAPEHLTWTQLSRIELLKLALDFKKKKTDSAKRLEQIYQDWLWLNYGYRGPEFTLDYFKQVFNELLNKDLDTLEKELSGILHNEEYVRQEKNKIFKQLQIDLKHQSFINSLSILSYLKVYRKDTAFLLIYLTNKIVTQFAGNLKRDNWLYLTLDEARDLINNQLKVSRQQMIEREKCSVLLGQENIILTGKAAEQFISDNVEKEDLDIKEKSVKLLEGTTACLGKTGDWVYGEVKVINSPEDMSKMQANDVLVSYATTPDIVTAMKKAAAIVTDVGGITSHAAIVSRELNIPCLIGTKYATKVFKDGDRVVVCPRHGYIKFQ